MQLPSAAGHRVRAVLDDLFPAPAESAPGAGLPRRAFLLVQAVTVAIGALVMLARIGGRPAWDSVYGEDWGIYLPWALAHPWHLVQSYAGYLQLVPRLIGQVAALVPIRHASAAFAAGGALVASGCGLFAYHASEGQVSSRWLRVLVGLSVVLLPVAQLEIADNGVNTIWYLLATLFWAALWRPRTRAGAAVAAVVALVVVLAAGWATDFRYPVGHITWRGSVWEHKADHWLRRCQYNPPGTIRVTFHMRWGTTRANLRTTFSCSSLRR